MAQGRIKRVANIDQKFGADAEYLFLKVQAQGRGEHGEEYWLVTDEEAEKFATRATENPEDIADTHLGIFTRVANATPKPAANDWYVSVKLRTADDKSVVWFLTEFDLERVRNRVEKNLEYVEANREGWLADLFD
jgi:hypothetical protein